MAGEEPDAGGSSEATVRLATWLVLGGALMLVLALFSVRSALGPDVPREYASRTLPPEPEPVLLTSEMDDEYYPCSDCHEGEPVNFVVRELEEEHDELGLAHGDLWCFACHDPEDQDNLHLSDDTAVAFEDSWMLCTQCHGKKLADWRAGVHGKRTGHWWGPKDYRTCVTCHDPHAPAFKPLEPKPAPIPPTEIVWTETPTTEEVADDAE